MDGIRLLQVGLKNSGGEIMDLKYLVSALAFCVAILATAMFLHIKEVDNNGKE